MMLRKPMVALGAVSMMLITEVGMASSLLLPNPAQLAGDWELYAENQQATACQLQLRAPETVLEGDLQCLQQLIGKPASGWLVTPDTLALMGSDGSAVVHFNRYRPNVYKWTTPAGITLLLERKSKE
ncbi:AprI/Inh family metalloprotease inhibitor [Pseudomonas sp. GZD-222]|uniref:AprI/Inh family metalloprotease inhibitor n=1 Tax=Pseudomonas sp. GZD-222 TaxID=3404805 RepID=UPI003BB6E673